MADQELQIKITTSADTTGASKAADALKEVGSAASGAASGNIKFLGALGQQQQAADQTAKGLGEASRAAAHANQTFQGLAAGGLGGTLRAFRGLVGLLRGGIFAAAGGGGAATGAAAGLIFAPFAVAMIEMRRKFEENVREMKATWQGLQDNADRYKESIGRITAETEKMKQETVAALEEIAKDYDKLRERQAAGEKRSQALNEAGREKERAELGLAREQALAAAKSPEERARIEQDFTRRGEQAESRYRRVDLENAKLNAPIQIQQATAAQKEARDQVAAAELELAKAEGEYKDLLQTAGMLTKRGDTDEANSVRERAKEAKLRMEQLQKATDELRAKAAETIDRAEKDIAEAQLTLEQIPLKAATEEAKEKTQILQRGGQYGAKIAAARSGAEAAGSRRTAIESQIAELEGQGATLGGGGYHPEREQKIAELKGQLEQVVQTESETYNALNDYLAAKSRQDRQMAKDLDEAANAARDAGPGS